MSALHVDHRPAAVATPDLPVVMLHGWAMNLAVFDLLRAEVPARETLAIDLPGHGRSPWWPDAARFEVQVEATLAALPPRCVLLGWSLGAKIAMRIAATHPERVAALVLVSATPKFAQSPDWPHGMDAESMRAFRALLQQDWRQSMRDFVWLQLRGSRHAETAQHAIETSLAAHGAPVPEALHGDMDLLGELDLRAEVARIAQPALIVSGQNDRVTSPDAARWLAKSLPAAGLLEVPRAGHAPFISHHSEVGAALRAFLDGLSAPLQS
jgi:pimeloyl-[acyl-carrier protein] methyl ester esterase